MFACVGQTFNSHRLVAFAGHQSLHTQNALVDELFRAYFAEVEMCMGHAANIMRMM